MLGGAGSWELGGVGGAGRGRELELGDGMCWEVLRGAGSWEELQGRDCWVHQIHRGDTSRLYTLRYDVVML